LRKRRERVRVRERERVSAALSRLNRKINDAAINRGPE
jgi:hypothetical protein